MVFALERPPVCRLYFGNTDLVSKSSNNVNKVAFFSQSLSHSESL